MPDITEAAAVESWLYATLRSDAALAQPVDGLSLVGGDGGIQVYAGLAPVRAEPPFIVFRRDEGSETTEAAICGAADVEAAYTVRVWGRETGYSPLWSWEKRIDDLLRNTTAEQDGWQITTQYEGSGRLPPVIVDGTRLYAAGGVYRIHTTPAT